MAYATHTGQHIRRNTTDTGSFAHLLLTSNYPQILKDPTAPRVSLHNLVNCVLKATIEKKTTSVTTHFKKLKTGNNMFIVSAIN